MRPDSAKKAEFREIFLNDASFGRLEAACVALEVDPFLLDRGNDRIGEFFRIVHTIKGNAAIAGVAGFGEYAHAVEDVLGAARDGRVSLDAALAAFLVGVGARIKACVVRAKNGGEISPDEESSFVEEARRFLLGRIGRTAVPRAADGEAASEQKPPVSESASGTVGFYLSIRIGGRELGVPADSVAGVLRRPQVMSIPRARRNWIGVIFSCGDLIPLLDPSSVVVPAAGVSVPLGTGALFPWVVVLKGRSATRPDESSLISVPVDDVIGVVEERSSRAPAATLDLTIFDAWA